jgi:hypothetical protein
MKKPLATYNIEINETDGRGDASLIWVAILDRRFKCEVQRTGTRQASLFVFDSKDNDKIIYESRVPLSYDAKFGPDIGDVGEWQEMCAKAVDDIIN